MNYEFTIIVPVFNEEDNLERLEKELTAFMQIAQKKTSVLLVNDGSTDNSQQLIEKICEKNSDYSFIQFNKNCGLSSALAAGFKHIETPLVGYIDADLQTSPTDFNKLLNFSDDYELVSGERTNRKDSFVKNTSSKIANSIRRAFTKDGMNDTNCPLKVFKTSYAKKIPMFDGLHRFLPAMILLQNGRIKQVQVQHFPRIAGTSKFGLTNRLIGPLTACFAFLWMKKNYINYNVAKKST